MSNAGLCTACQHRAGDSRLHPHRHSGLGSAGRYARAVVEMLHETGNEAEELSRAGETLKHKKQTSECSTAKA